MTYPSFTAAVPAGTYHLRVVDDPLGSATNYDLDIVITAGSFFFIPDAGVTDSIWYALDDAGQTAGFSFSAFVFTATNDQGVQCEIRGVNQFKIDYTNSSAADDGKLPLTWFGLENTDYTSAASGNYELTTVQHPQYCWHPKAHLNDLGTTPLEFQSYTSHTIDGSTSVVSHEDSDPNTSRPMWRHVQVDGFAGALGARMQYDRLHDTYQDFYTGAGITDPSSTADPYAALDSDGGFWRATCAGRKFKIVRDEATASSRIGPYRILRTGAGSPFDMDSWYSLQPPCVNRTNAGGGRRWVEMAFIEA